MSDFMAGWRCPGAWPVLLTASGRGLRQIPHANQIVSRRGEGEHPSDSVLASMPGFAQPRDGLDPAEDLFDSLALSLADRVAFVSRGALINGAGAPLMLVLRHVRSHRRFAQLAHKVPRIVILVAPQRYLPSAAGNPRRHVQRRVALSGSGLPRQPRVRQSTVARFHHDL